MLVRANFPDLVLEDALPAIDDVVFETMAQYPSVVDQVFRQLTSSRAIEQDTEVTGLGNFTEVAEGSNVTYDQPVQGYDKTYRHAQHALGFKVTRVMKDDEKHGIVMDMARQLGRSRHNTREVLGASVFNNAFTGGATAGPDGVALCATNHPLAKSGGTQANRPTTGSDLDVDSLQLALTGFRKFKSHSGKYVKIQPRKLLIPAESEFIALETLNVGQGMRGDTANNTTNSFNHRIGLASNMQIIVWEELTDDDAWFILADQNDTGLKWYTRERPNTIHDVDFDSRSLKTAMWERYSYGFSNFWGVWGNPGV